MRYEIRNTDLISPKFSYANSDLLQLDRIFMICGIMDL